MTLTEDDKNEIRALVAEEIHNVLRREMAQWWAESVMTLAGYPPRSRRGALTDQRGATKPGGSGQPAVDGSGDGDSGEGIKKPVKPKKLGQRGGLTSSAGANGTAGVQGSAGAVGDEEYMTRVIESLLRSQEALAEQLQESIRRIQELLSQDLPN